MDLGYDGRVSEKPKRLLPLVTPENQHYWTGGAEGQLRLLRCDACRHFVHPPAPVCPECLSRELSVAAVSGRAELLTYTVNHQPWLPGFPPPYVVAIVAIDEQPSLRITSNIVNCAPEALRIGMPLRVCFEECDDVWLPLFEPEQA